MKDSYSSNNWADALAFSETLPGQFIVTDKKIDQKMYEQFVTELEWIDPQPDYTILVRQGKELLGSTMPISEKRSFWCSLPAGARQKPISCCDNTAPDLIPPLLSGAGLPCMNAGCV